ncbi:hypothetical protein B0H13DRAFT_2354013 [Mycena leptocephala]|nr:hypothetical protein B0H13DRAFT_2354013 [Mycena leptocephala]
MAASAVTSTAQATLDAELQALIHPLQRSISWKSLSARRKLTLIVHLRRRSRPPPPPTATPTPTPPRATQRPHAHAGGMAGSPLPPSRPHALARRTRARTRIHTSVLISAPPASPRRAPPSSTRMHAHHHLHTRSCSLALPSSSGCGSSYHPRIGGMAGSRAARHCSAPYTQRRAASATPRISTCAAPRRRPHTLASSAAPVHTCVCAFICCANVRRRTTPAPTLVPRLHLRGHKRIQRRAFEERNATTASNTRAYALRRLGLLDAQRSAIKKNS